MPISGRSITAGMDTINWSNLTPAFRQFAANSHVMSGKISIGNESRSAISARPVRDELTLSHEGRAAYEKIVSKVNKTQQSLNDATLSVGGLNSLEKVENVQIYEPKQALDMETAFRSIEALTFDVALEKHSTHVSPLAWALGIDTTGKSVHNANNLELLHTEPVVRALRAQLQTNRQKIDAKITNILQSNSIILGKDETLDIKINQSGKITVGDKMGTDKREKIEKLLNEDKTLAFELLYTHAERTFAVLGDYPGSRPSSKPFHAAYYILTDTILRQEYGVSLDDFRMSGLNDNGEWENGRSIVAKDGNDDILDSIYNEERMLYHSIENALSSLEENGGDFEVNFAYKNGVTIEQGATDQPALTKVTEMFTAWHYLNTRTSTKCSVTLDPTGWILNAQVTDAGNGFILTDASRKLNQFFRAAEQTDMSCNNAAISRNSNVFPTQSRLQQYVFDAQRLFQYNTGVDSATAKAMNVTFNTSGTAW